MPDQNGECEIRFRIPAIISAELKEMASLLGFDSQQDLARQLFYIGKFQLDCESRRNHIIKSIKEGREVKW